MTGRRMTPDEHFDEIEALGAELHAQLPEELRERHRIDRSRLTQGAQCVCTCGATCVFWVAHLQDVRDHREMWDRLEAEYPIRVLLGAGEIPPAWSGSGRIFAIPDDDPDPEEVGACCEHEYRRHLIGLDGCADCEQHEPEHARCEGWRRQLEGAPA